MKLTQHFLQIKSRLVEMLLKEESLETNYWITKQKCKW